MSTEAKPYREVIVNDTKAAVHEMLQLREQGFISFRGHRNYVWKLGPHHLPEDEEGKKQEEILETIRLQFVKRCKEFASFDLKAEDFWHTVIFGQHHGLKTRLLDWTSNPLVALYFAVENILSKCNDPNIYGCVWAVRVPPDKWRSVEHLKGGTLIEWRLPSWVMINPPLVNDRIIRQSGKFSYHPSRVDDDISILPRAPHETLVKILIGNPRAHEENPADRIRWDLGIMNVHHGSLFPDFDGVARFINHEWPDLQKQRSGELAKLKPTKDEVAQFVAPIVSADLEPMKL